MKRTVLLAGGALAIVAPLLHAALGALTLANGLWLVLQMNDVLRSAGTRPIGAR